MVWGCPEAQLPPPSLGHPLSVIQGQCWGEACSSWLGSDQWVLKIASSALRLALKICPGFLSQVQHLKPEARAWVQSWGTWQHPSSHYIPSSFPWLLTDWTHTSFRGEKFWHHIFFSILVFYGIKSILCVLQTWSYFLLSQSIHDRFLEFKIKNYFSLTHPVLINQ